MQFVSITLRSMLASFKKSTCNKVETNNRFLNTPQQKRKRESVRKQLKSLAIQNKRMRDKVNAAREDIGVTVDPELEEDFSPVIAKTQSYIDRMPLNDFQRVFWEQQVKW